MDPRFVVTREDLYSLQMEVKQVQFTQNNHTERISRLEKRQADDAALKSVWNSPFPGVLSGTPQTGPVSIAHNDVFDDLDEQGEQLLDSLHLGPAEEEPVRRGAASRANSVRFDESALQGSGWGGQNHRHSGEFVPIRPGSGMMMERSLSHKSDGRHSSAGHSVHSHHSVASGRASSLGLDTNFAMGDESDDSFDIPGPPPSFYVLGTVPAIVRCWLTTSFAHNTLLYADVCTGSQKSTIDITLLRELDLLDEIHRDVDGILRTRLNVYFAEAIITQHNRSGTPPGPVPSIMGFFEVTGMDAPMSGSDRKAIRIYLGSDALRAHSADILFSQNTMTLYSTERNRLQVPFVRPEDEAVFRNIYTSSIVQEKQRKLNANAVPFVLGDVGADQSTREAGTDTEQHGDETQSSGSPNVTQAHSAKHPLPSSGISETSGEGDQPRKTVEGPEIGSKEGPSGFTTSDAPRRDSSASIWGSWRQVTGGGDGSRENGPLSGYQPAGRSGRNMKVLKPQKLASVSTRAVSSEPTATPTATPTSNKGPVESRRKSQAGTQTENGAGGTVNRWEGKRAASVGSEAKSQTSTTRDSRHAPTLPRSVNPVGVASAFSWMTPSAKPKTPTAITD